MTRDRVEPIVSREDVERFNQILERQRDNLLPDDWCLMDVRWQEDGRTGVITGTATYRKVMRAGPGS